jgi:hypothetical protein
LYSGNSAKKTNHLLSIPYPIKNMDQGQNHNLNGKKLEYTVVLDTVNYKIPKNIYCESSNPDLWEEIPCPVFSTAPDFVL